MSRKDRNTICVEDAEVLQQVAFPEQQFVLRLRAPRTAGRAIPGSFAHIRCATDLPMRRPLSIMRARPDDGWIEVLYKIVGQGLDRLAAAEPGDLISVIAPIGNGFSISTQRTTPLLIGGGVGIPPLIFFAEHLATQHPETQPVAFFGSEIPFPFELQTSIAKLDGAPASATASLRCMEDIGVPSRLATNAGYDGCYAGYVTDLTRQWLHSLPAERLATIMVFSCGPEPMLEAVAKLADEFTLPSQLCLEEFMACAVGGCAGCAVEVQTPDGPAMKRVCVDGPVFAGETIYPPK